MAAGRAGAHLMLWRYTPVDNLLFHPKVVHLPIALGVLMPLFAAGLAVAWWRKWLPPRAWLLAVALQGVLVLSGVVALSSGEREEDRVEAVVAESLIETHEEAAEVFVWASGGVFAIMLLSAALLRRPSGLAMAAAATLGTIVVLGLGYRTGQAGGELVYEHGAASAYVGPSGPGPAPPPAHDLEEEEEDDD